MRPVRIVTLPVVAAATSAVLTVTAGAGPAEWLFGTVTVTALLLVLDHGARSGRAAGREWVRAADVLAVAPAVAARDAVLSERRRLADDIAADLRTCVERILHSVELAQRRQDAGQDPLPQVRAIHQAARQATSDLRRHLGLLRDPLTLSPDPPAPGNEAPDRPNLRDLLVAGAVTALALIEAIVYPRVEGLDRPWLSVVLTVIAAAAIVGRRTAPGPAAATIAAAYLVAIPFDAPVVGGFWCLASIGGVLWTIAARPTSTRIDAAAALFLLMAASMSAWLLDGDNAALLTATAVVALVGGVTVRLTRNRATAARARADAHERDVAAARAAARAAERQAFAREIHDVVSHAVGLIAVQAAAAEVSWQAHPDRCRAALRVIAETAATTRRELNRLPPDHVIEGPRPDQDLPALIDRIRSAGVRVEVTGADHVPRGRPDVVYRIALEALTNVVRHSGATTARVDIVTTQTELEITVVDDGVGAVDGSDRGYGLVGLAERVGFAGGTLTTGPGVGGRGFRVHARLPAAADRVAT